MTFLSEFSMFGRILAYVSPMMATMIFIKMSVLMVVTKKNKYGPTHVIYSLEKS
jgi:hypothetical protein